MPFQKEKLITCEVLIGALIHLNNDELKDVTKKCVLIISTLTLKLDKKFRKR